MSRDTRETAQAFYDAFLSMRDPAEFCAQHFDENATWEIFLPDSVPYGGRYRGRDAIRDYLVTVFGHLQMKHFEVKTLIVEGDTAVALGAEAGYVPATGRTMESDFVHVIRFENGKVAHGREYYDTYAMERAFS